MNRPKTDGADNAAREIIDNIARSPVINVLRFVHMRNFVASLPEDAVILSAGCGRGMAELALSLTNPALRWLGLDYDPGRYAMAQTIAQETGHDGIRFVQGDLNLPPVLPTERVDAVILSEVLMYLEDPANTVSALCNILKPGGQMMIVEPFLDSPDQADQRDRLRRHTQSLHGGFTGHELTTLAASIETTRTFSCYSARVVDRLNHLWKLMSNADDWHLASLLFDLAEQDLHLGKSNSRRDAVAIGIIGVARHEPG